MRFAQIYQSTVSSSSSFVKMAAAGFFFGVEQA